MGLSFWLVNCFNRLLRIRLNSVRFYGFLLALFGLASCGYILLFGITTKDSPGSSVVVSQSAVEKFWFSPAGDLFVIDRYFQGGAALVRYHLKGDAWDAQSHVPLRMIEYAHACGQAGALSGALPYSVSRDGLTIVLGLDADLCIVSISAKGGMLSVVTIKTERKSKISAVEFTDSALGFVVAVFEDGSVRFYGSELPRIKEFGTYLGGMPPFALFSGVQSLVAVSLGSGKLVCAEAGGKNGVPSAHSADLGDEIKHLSGSGVNCDRIVIGEANGVVVFPRQDKRVQGRVQYFLQPYYVAPGGVRALAFAENGDVFIGGDFGSIYQMKNGGRPREFMSAPPGVRMIAVAKRRLAFLSSDLEVVNIDIDREINFKGGLFVGIVGLLATLFGVFLALVPLGGRNNSAL